MAYTRRSKKSTYTRKNTGVKALARPKSTSIQKLASAVTKLQRAGRVNSEYLNFGQFENDIPMVSPYYAVSLSRPSTWSAIFGSGTDDTEANKIMHKSVGIDMRISLEAITNNEENTVNFTAFLVSLKDEIGPALTLSNGNLTLQDNAHYFQRGGLTLLNKKAFNIHKMKRFTLTNFGQGLDIAGAQSQYGADTRFYWRVPINKVIQNPYSGNWRGLGTVQDPSKCYYILIFNDNSSLDGENPTMNYTAVHTLKTMA